MKFVFIRDNREDFDLGLMCATFAVTRAGFYAWSKRPDGKRAKRAKALAEQIRIVHSEVDGVYGSIKITRELMGENPQHQEREADGLEPFEPVRLDRPLG